MSKAQSTNHEFPNGLVKHKPISQTDYFLSLFCSAVLLAALWSTYTAISFPLPRANAPPGVYGFDGKGIIVAIIVLIASAALLKRADWLNQGCIFVRGRTVFIVLLYTIVSILVSSGDSDPFLLYTVLNGGYFAIVYEVYSHPLVPQNAGQRRMEIHQTNWWRFTQVFLTGSIAILIGICLNFFLGKFNGFMAISRVLVVPLIGILSILFYVGWKHRLIELEA